MSMPTKKQRAFVAKMKWPPCPITDGSGNPISPLRFAVRQYGNQVVMSADTYAKLVSKVNAAIAALERMVGNEASYDLIEHDGAKHCVHCGREYLATDVAGKLCPSEDCPGFMCRAALEELKK